MTRPSMNRREFLRRAGVTAGTLGVAGGVVALPGCGDSTTDPPAPPAPTNLTVTVFSAERIDLAWIDNASDETAYEVERRLGTETDFTSLATLPSDQVGYPDESVMERMMYVYRVRTVAEGRASGYSNEVEATTPAAGAPLPPLDVVVASVATDGAVITWADVAVNESGYRVERVDDTSVVTILTLPAGSTSAGLNGLAADDLFRVRVIAVNEIGDSPASTEVRFFTGMVAAAIEFTPLGPGQLRVSWTDRSNGRLGFQFDRDAGAGFEPIATLPTGTLSFEDTAFPLGVTAVYRVSAAGAVSVAPPTASMDIPGAPPSAPTSAAAELVSTNGSRIGISWQHPGSNDLTGFAVERRISTGNFTQLPRGHDALQRSLEDLPNSVFVPVTYRVVSWNLAGNSPPSMEAVITPRAVFFFIGNLAVLGTVNKGAAVTISRPAVSVGATCNASTTSIYLVRESPSRIAAVVAHCTHECLRPPSFNWNESATRFRCSHGSEFNLLGEVLHGPASRSIATLQTVLFDDRVELLPPG